MPDVGGRTDEIRAVEARLGHVLSPSLREWVAFAHDVRRSQRYIDVRRDYYQMEELVGLSAVSLLLEGEGDYHWAIRHSDLALKDPPIHGFRWDFEQEDEETFVPDGDDPVAPTLTSFVLHHVLDYTQADGGGFGTSIADRARLLRDLKATFPVHCRWEKLEIFEAENVLVRVGPRSYTAPGGYLSVEVFKPLPREAVPELLWEYTRGGGSFHGMFIPERPEDRRRRLPPAQAGAEDDIPF
jgi:hypothetical protein